MVWTADKAEPEQRYCTVGRHLKYQHRSGCKTLHCHLQLTCDNSDKLS